MESGTDTKICDIWGVDQNHIWATARINLADDEHPHGYESITLFSDGDGFEQIYVSPPLSPTYQDSISGYMNSVWAYKDTVYISSEAGLWKESVKTGNGHIEHGGSEGYLDGRPFIIRGTGYNDVYAFTRWGEFLHYNGNSWYRDLTHDGYRINGAAVSRDQVVMVGHLHYLHAIVIRGHHIN